MKFKFLFLHILHIFWIIVLSYIPVYYTWGRLAVGGDVLIFFSSKGLRKYLYQWIPYHNGLNYPINYYPLYFLYSIAENFRFDPYQVSALVLFILSVLAGLGIYKLAKSIYEKNGLFMLIPITFYILSPALLNGWHYLYIYSTAPWFIYFIIKILREKEISIGNIIWLNVVIFFSSMDLPNPKYLFFMFIIMFILIFLGILFRLISLKLITKSWFKIILFFLLSAYIYLPLFQHYTQFSGVIPVKQGYKTEGKMPDFGFTTINRIFTLHHLGVNLNTIEADKYTSNHFITFLSYAFIFLIIINLIFKNRDEEMYKYELIFFILTLIFLLFAAGPNPPLGFLYEYLVTNLLVFAFLRTTAGAVFFASIFYAILLGFFIQKIDKLQKLFIVILMIIIGVVNYPYINGEFFKNFNRVNPHTDRQAYGFRIPQIYFDIVDTINNQKIDAKYLHTRSNLGYISTRWGYFGPVIYFFLYNSHNLAYTEIYSNLANHNIGYIFTDNSSTDPGKRFKYQTGEDLVRKNPIIIERISRNEFLPHFYTPQRIILTDRSVDDVYQIIDQPDYNIRSAIYIDNEDFPSQNPAQLKKLPKEVNTNPILEFKKVDPTKYRVLVHQAKNNFMLVFSETFHKGWKAYLAKPDKSSKFKVQSSKLENYKILDDNEEDQATQEELKSYIDKDWITSLGKGKIDFISKNFQDTIQNGNLPAGDIWETWLAKDIKDQPRRDIGTKIKNILSLNKNYYQLPEEKHQQANVFANSWWIEIEEICKLNSLCTKNPDGSYDMEIVVEFWPQRVFYLGVIITLSTLFISLLYLTFNRGKAIVLSKS